MLRYPYRKQGALLYHRHYLDDTVYDDKIIGIYSSYKKAIDTMNTYSNLPGFSDYAEDFHVESFPVTKKESGDCAYILIGIKLIDDCDCTVSYNVYENRLSAFEARLRKRISTENNAVKYYIDEYIIDEDNWCEGFVVVPPHHKL